MTSFYEAVIFKDRMYSTGGIYQPGETQQDHEGSRKEKHNEFKRVFEKVGAEEGVYAQQQQEKRNSSDNQELQPP
ncbi:MAG TPA: hypothetical protein VIK19_09590 [Syntrophales bacterium]|jgi:hypothetical protein